MRNKINKIWAIACRIAAFVGVAFSLIAAFQSNYAHASYYLLTYFFLTSDKIQK